MAQNMMDERLKQLKEMLRLEKEITKEQQKRAKQQKDAAKKDKQNKKKLADRNVPGTQLKLGTLAKVAGAVTGAFELVAQRTKSAIDNVSKLTNSFAKLTTASDSLRKVSEKSAKLTAFGNLYDYYKALTSGATGGGIKDVLKASELSNYLDSLGKEGGQKFLKQYNDDIYNSITSSVEASLIGKGATYSSLVPMHELGNKLVDIAIQEFGTAGGFGTLADERSQEFLANVLSGKLDDTFFSLEGLDSYMYRQGLLPEGMGIQYASADVLEQAKLEYLLEQANEYLKNGRDGVMNIVSNDVKQSKMLKAMSGSLYSFDEVITTNAINSADNLEAAKENNDIVASVKQTAQDAAEQASRDALLQQNKTDMVRKVLEDGEVTQEEIQWLLDNGFSSVEEIAIYMAKLQGIEPTLANINAISSALDDTLKNGVTLTINRLNDILDEGIKVQIDNNLNLDDYNLTPEQMAELAKALADNLLTDEEIKRLKTLGFTDDQINQILEDLGIIKRNTGLTAYNNASEIMQKVGTPYQKFLSAVANIIGPDLEDYGISKDDYDTLKNTGTGMTLKREAAGGIGTSPSIIEAFEKGPEAIIPLNDSGIQFMSEAIKNANIEGGIGGSGDINVNLTLSGLNISDKRDWEEVGIKIGQVIQNYKNRTGGI